MSMINKQEIKSMSPFIQTRDVTALGKETKNVYKALCVIAKRANQISSTVKEELHSKLEEFAPTSDNLEEIFENTEQIEISKFYEKMPNATLLAVQEFIEGKIFYRDVEEEA